MGAPAKPRRLLIVRAGKGVRTVSSLVAAGARTIAQACLSAHAAAQSFMSRRPFAAGVLVGVAFLGLALRLASARDAQRRGGRSLVSPELSLVLAELFKTSLRSRQAASGILDKVLVAAVAHGAQQLEEYVSTASAQPGDAHKRARRRT